MLTPDTRRETRRGSGGVPMEVVTEMEGAKMEGAKMEGAKMGGAKMEGWGLWSMVWGRSG